MTLSKEEINRVADDVWQDMKSRVDIGRKRPHITISDEETKQRLGDLARHYDIKADIPHYIPKDAYASILRLVNVKEGHTDLLISPVQIKPDIPLDTAKVMLAHEFGHYLYLVSDPHFAATVYMFLRGLENDKEIEVEQKEKTKFLLEAVEESLAWIPPIEMYGERYVIDNMLKHLEKDASMPEIDRRDLCHYHNLMMIYTSFMNDDGVGMKNLLDPLSVVESHPTTRLDPSNKARADDFLEAYADVRTEIAPDITAFVDDAE